VAAGSVEPAVMPSDAIQIRKVNLNLRQNKWQEASVHTMEESGPPLPCPINQEHAVKLCQKRPHLYNDGVRKVLTRY